MFYDPDVYTQPVRIHDRFLRQATLDDPNQRYTVIECLSNIANVNGHPTQLTKADPRYVDYYGRPWVQEWENNFEKGWDKPEESGRPRRRARPVRVVFSSVRTYLHDGPTRT